MRERARLYFSGAWRVAARADIFGAWAWGAMILALLAAAVARLGWWEALWKADHTHLSVFTIAVGVASYLRAGLEALRLDAMNAGMVEVDQKFKDDPTARYEWMWFIAEKCMALGMLGTIIGFVLMLGAFLTGVDMANAEAVRGLFAAISAGLGTALYGTMTGLAASMLTKLAAYSLSREAERTALGVSLPAPKAPITPTPAAAQNQPAPAPATAQKPAEPTQVTPAPEVGILARESLPSPSTSPEVFSPINGQVQAETRSDFHEGDEAGGKGTE